MATVKHELVLVFQVPQPALEPVREIFSNFQLSNRGVLCRQGFRRYVHSRCLRCKLLCKFITKLFDLGGAAQRQQRDGFPDLGSLQLSESPADVLERCREAAESLGWTITLVDAEALRLEAYDTTSVFRFVDDVVVRVRPSSTGSVVDLRSNSRVGGGDLGANAARIIAFQELLKNP